MGSEPLEPAVERDWEGRLIPFEAIEVSVAFWASCFPLPSFSFAFWGGGDSAVSSGSRRM